MTTMQIKLLPMIAEIEKILSAEKGLRYSASSATMLGAIRHNGFVPGDDDADYEIHAEDYKKALGLLKSKLPKRYKVIDSDEIKYTSISFSKIIDLETEVETKWNESDNLKVAGFLSVDIFKIYTTENEISAIRAKRGADIRQIRNFVHKNHFINVGKSFFKLIPTAFIARRIEKIYENDKGTKFFYTTWIGKPRRAYKLNFKFETIEVLFEGNKIKVGKEYDKYLRTLYGDYTKLPVESDRSGKHGLSIKKK